MLFTVIKTENIVQVDDKTRIDISKTFISGLVPVIDSFEIEPEAGAGYIDVTTDMFLDWAYETSGDKVITVKATDDALNEITKAHTLTIVTAEEDNLFSNDGDIIPYESDLLQWVQEGRSSFLDKHRAAQAKILNDLDSARIWKDDGTRYEAADIVDIQEFKDWSKFQALRVIFEGVSNTSDDVFTDKANKYKGMAISAKKRATFRLDSNGDGENSVGEEVDNVTSYLVRR